MHFFVFIPSDLWPIHQRNLWTFWRPGEHWHSDISDQNHISDQWGELQGSWRCQCSQVSLSFESHKKKCNMFISTKAIIVIMFMSLFVWRLTAKAVAVLLPILGISWIFGVLAVNTHSLAFLYVFAVFNSLQVRLFSSQALLLIKPCCHYC